MKIVIIFLFNNSNVCFGLLKEKKDYADIFQVRTLIRRPQTATLNEPACDMSNEGSDKLVEMRRLTRVFAVAYKKVLL